MIIFLLFLYPVMRMKNTCAPNIESTKFRVKRILSRAAKSMAASSLSDTISIALVILVFQKDLPRSLNSAMYDFSLVINAISIILCFEDLPLFSKSNVKNARKDVELANEPTLEVKQDHCDSRGSS